MICLLRSIFVNDARVRATLELRLGECFNLLISPVTLRRTRAQASSRESIEKLIHTVSTEAKLYRVVAFVVSF